MITRAAPLAPGSAGLPANEARQAGGNASGGRASGGGASNISGSASSSISAGGAVPGAAIDRVIDSAIEVVTPENIAFEYRVAGPFRRLCAALIDLLIRTGVLTAMFFLLVILAGVTFGVPDIGAIGIGVGMIVWFVADWFYGGLFETYMNGQTPGKRLMRLRVVTTSGEPIDGGQAVIRNLLRYADMFPVLSLEVLHVPAPVYIIPTFFLGLGCMMLNRRYQRLGDLVGNTIVVIEEPRWLLGVAKLDDPRAVQLASYLPIQLQVSRSMAKALSTYVERRRYFSAPRRREIARHLAEPLLEKFGLPRDTSYDLLLCAMYYRTFIADRQDDDEHAAAIGHAPFVAPAPGYVAFGAPAYPPPAYGAPGFGSPQYPPPQYPGPQSPAPQYPAPQYPGAGPAASYPAPMYIGPEAPPLPQQEMQGMFFRGPPGARPPPAG